MSSSTIYSRTATTADIAAIEARTAAEHPVTLEDVQSIRHALATMGAGPEIAILQRMWAELQRRR